MTPVTPRRSQARPGQSGSPPIHPRPGHSRRQVLKASLAAPVGYWIATGNAWGQSRSPNEKLHVACIGVGGKGKTDVTSTEGAGARIVALCDVDDARARESYARYPDVPRFHDYRVMLDRMHRQIDAVIVSTPDHMHAVQTMAAMKLGKHVYTQKPLTHNVYEARLLTETARSTGLVTQMGNQGTASDTLREAIEVIRSGAIGAVREVHVWTNRPVWPQGAQALMQHASVRAAIHGRSVRPAVPASLKWDLWLGCAPQRPYDPIYVPFNWRGWHDFGTGALGDMACHLMNMPYLALQLGAPTRIEARCAPDMTEETFPSWSVVDYDFPARGERPAVRLTWYDGGKNMPEAIRRKLTELAGTTTLPASGSVCLGEKGSLVSVHETGARYRLLPREKFADYEPPSPTLPRVPGHYHEWVRACIENRPDMPMSRFETAGPFTEAVLLGCVALRAGKAIEWDAEKFEITNHAGANAWLRREYRAGFTI